MHWRDFPSSHCSIILAVEDGSSYSSSRRLWSAICDKVFECSEHSADRNSSYRIQVRRVPSSNPGANQTDWGSFRGFPQSSRQMLCYIYITMVHLTIIHKIHKSQILRVKICKRTLDTRWVSHSGSNPRWETSTTQGYKSWSHSMTNVSIPEVNMLKNSSTLAVAVPISHSIKLCFVSVNSPRET